MWMWGKMTVEKTPHALYFIGVTKMTLIKTLRNSWLKEKIQFYQQNLTKIHVLELVVHYKNNWGVKFGYLRSNWGVKLGSLW